MSLEDLIKTLEQKLPGFSYTLFSHQPGMPVMLQWNHRSPDLQKREAMMPRSIVAKDIKSAFEQVAGRYAEFDRQDTLKKQEAEKAAKRRVQWVEGPHKGGQNLSYQITERPPDPPPMRRAKEPDEPKPKRRSVVLPE